MSHFAAILRGSGRRKKSLTWCDLCIDESGENIRLEQIVTVGRYVGIGGYSSMVHKPSKSVADEGLRHFAEGDYSQLHVVVPSTQGRHLLLKGWVTQDGGRFVTLSAFDPSGDPFDVVQADELGLGRQVFYGELVEGDVFVRRPIVNDRLVQGPGIDIELRYSIVGSVGMYVGYFFKSIKIMDRNIEPTLELELTEGKLSDAITIRDTHHSLTDSMTIKTESARYEIGYIEEIGAAMLRATYADGRQVQTPLNCMSLANCGTPLSDAAP